MIRLLRPQRCLELGVLEGFSLLAAASALRDNEYGHITGYDLFEMYPFRYAAFRDVQTRCRNAGLDRYITLHQAAADEALARHAEVDFLHIDLSNDGATFRTLFSRWAPKVTQAIVLEGGSPERDGVPWMQEYGRPSIEDALKDLRTTQLDWDFAVIDPLPSLTIAVRRQEPRL
jgi:hypothetical protein